MRDWRLAVFFLVTVATVAASGTLAEAPDIDGRAQADRALRASVVIKRSVPGEAHCGGTFVADGTVLTAYHCVRDLVENPEGVAWAQAFDQRVSRVALRQYWAGLDLAILSVDLSGRSAQLAPDVAVGEAVWISGAPAGEPFTLARGIVSRVYVGNFHNEPKTVVIGIDQQQIVVTDAAVWQGNSGGGLFNQDGQLVGMLVRLLRVTWEDGKRPRELVFSQVLYGYAVGVDSIRKVVAR